MGDAEKTELENPKKTILVVDDTPFSLRTLKTLLEGTFNVLLAKSGPVAFKMLEGDARPELILLDIEMPEMDGFTAMKDLQEKYPEIPVICFTSHLATEEFVQKVIDYGFKGYIRKPFETEILFHKIESTLGIPRIPRVFPA